MSREQMRIEEDHYLCDHCDSPIIEGKDGYIVHGNIYFAFTDRPGGLVGDNFPKSVGRFQDEEVCLINKHKIKKNVFCVKCFKEILFRNKD